MSSLMRAASEAMREEQVGKTTWQVASRVAEMAARDLEAVKKELEFY